MASGFRKRSFLYTGCFGGSVCNASDRIAHPGYRHSDASWGSTVDLCRFFKPDSNSTRSLDLTFFQSKRKCFPCSAAICNQQKIGQHFHKDDSEKCQRKEPHPIVCKKLKLLFASRRITAHRKSRRFLNGSI